MKILYVADSLGLGGANQTTVTVAMEMKRRGHEVYFAAGPGPLAEALHRAGIEWYEIDTGGRHPSFKLLGQLRAILLNKRCELMCTTDYNCTISSIPAAYRAGVPVFPTYAGLFLPPYPHPWLPRINVFSEELAQHSVNRFGWEKESFVSLIARIDGERFNGHIAGSNLRAELGISGEAFVLTMVCRLDRVKAGGVSTLLDASLKLKKAIPAIRIVLFGDGSSRQELLSTIERLNKRGGSEFIFSPGATLRTPEAYAMADVVIANGARSAMEGMACGKPVVCVGQNGFCGVISERSVASFRRFNFDKGRLRGNPIGKLEHLVETIVRLHASPEVRGALGEFSAHYAQECLLVQTGGPVYEREYDSIVKRGVYDWPWDKIMLRWCKSVVLLYWQRVKRTWSYEARSWRDRLAPPVNGVEPEWETGLLE